MENNATVKNGNGKTGSRQAVRPVLDHTDTTKQPTDKKPKVKDKVLNSVAIENALTEFNHSFRLCEMDESIEHNGSRLTQLQYMDMLLDASDCSFKVEKDVNGVMYRMAKRKTFHPIIEYLDGLTWDGQDHISKLAAYFGDKHEPIKYADGSKKSVFQAFFTRYLIGAIGKVFNVRRENIEDYWQNPVLVLAGKQGLGKGNFIAWLARDVSKYYSEVMFNPDEKDLDWNLSCIWISEMSEAMRTLNKSDSDALKFKLTQKKSRFRKPYDRHFTEATQITNPIATLNPTGVGFFKDQTGNRRFNAVELTSIDWSYKTDIKPSDVWAQAYALYKAGETNRLTPEEQTVQLRITDENTEPAVIEDYLRKLFILEPENKAFHRATTDIMQTLLENGYKSMSPRALQMEIGTALTAMGFTKGKYGGLNGWYGVIVKGESPAAKAALSS